MSRIATRIRGYVNDPSVSDHYGEWGALRPDQRRQIRELCDTCDMFEKAADELAKQSEGHWISKEEAELMDRFDLAYTCSVCGHCDWDCTESENFNFCPNCGAKMKGE